MAKSIPRSTHLATWKVAFHTVAIATLIVTGTNFRALAKAKKPVQNVPLDGNDPKQAKIARAMSAGLPTDIASSARIVDPDAQGPMAVLREGSSGFT